LLPFKYHLLLLPPSSSLLLLPPLGTDTYHDLVHNKWKRSEELQKKVELVVVNRSGMAFEIPPEEELQRREGEGKKR